MSEHSEISADSQTGSIGATGEATSRLRLAFVPSLSSSAESGHDLNRLGGALAQESDTSFSGGVHQIRGIIGREISLWSSVRRANTLVVQVCGLTDLVLRWFPALVISRLNGIRIVGLVDFESLQFQKPIVRQLIRKLLAKADVLVTSTEWQAGGLRRIGLSAQVIAPVQDDIAAETIDKVQPHLCLTAAKDQMVELDRILQSFALVKQKYPRAEITVVASRDVHNEVYDRATNAGVSISQSMQIADRETQSNQAVGDIVISLDRDTEFPQQLVSAWRTGRPALVPAFSLVSSVVRDDFNGLIYSSATVAGLADAIIRLVEHPELVQQLSSQGLTEARAYRWDSLRIHWRRVLFSKK